MKCSKCGADFKARGRKYLCKTCKRAPEPPAAGKGPTLVKDERFQPALETYLKKHDWQPNIAERIEGFSSGWVACRGKASKDGE